MVFAERHSSVAAPDPMATGALSAARMRIAARAIGASLLRMSEMAVQVCVYIYKTDV